MKKKNNNEGWYGTYGIKQNELNNLLVNFNIQKKNQLKNFNQKL
jgi:hypothetical protein